MQAGCFTSVARDVSASRNLQSRLSKYFIDQSGQLLTAGLSNCTRVLATDCFESELSIEYLVVPAVVKGGYIDVYVRREVRESRAISAAAQYGRAQFSFSLCSELHWAVLFCYLQRSKPQPACGDAFKVYRSFFCQFTCYCVLRAVFFSLEYSRVQ